MLKVTKENFAKEVLEHSGPVLVDFWAEWCGPCKRLGELLGSLKELEGKVKIVKVNADKDPELAASHHVQSLPTLLLFRNGQVENGIVGLVPKAEILKLVNIKG